MYIVYYMIIGLIIYSVAYAIVSFIVQGGLSNNYDVRALQLGLTCLLLVYYSSIPIFGVYEAISNYFDIFLHIIILNKIISSDLFLYLSNLNITYISTIYYLEIDWYYGSGIQKNVFNLTELFPLHSSPESNINYGVDKNLPSVGASSSIVINPENHVASGTITENKLTIAATVNKDSVPSGIKTVYNSMVNAATELAKNPGTSITTAVGISAGTKAGLEVVKQLPGMSPAAKVAAVVATGALTSTTAVGMAETAKYIASEQARNSVFNKPLPDNRAPSPPIDNSTTLFSPADNNEGWSWTFTFETVAEQGTTSALQHLYNALILFQVVMFLIFVYLSILVIMQIIVNTQSDNTIFFINRFSLPLWFKYLLISILNNTLKLHRNFYKYIIVFNIFLFCICSLFSIFLVSDLITNVDYYCSDHINFQAPPCETTNNIPKKQII